MKEKWSGCKRERDICNVQMHFLGGVYFFFFGKMIIRAAYKVTVCIPLEYASLKKKWVPLRKSWLLFFLPTVIFFLPLKSIWYIAADITNCNQLLSRILACTVKKKVASETEMISASNETLCLTIYMRITRQESWLQFWISTESVTDRQGSAPLAL